MKKQLVVFCCVLVMFVSTAYAIMYRARYTIVPAATHYKLSIRLLPTPWSAVTPVATGVPPIVNGALETEFDLPPTPGIWEVQVEACDATQCSASNPMTVSIPTFTATATGTSTRTTTIAATRTPTMTATSTRTITPIDTPQLLNVFKP